MNGLTTGSTRPATPAREPERWALQTNNKEAEWP